MAHRGIFSFAVVGAAFPLGACASHPSAVLAPQPPAASATAMTPIPPPVSAAPTAIPRSAPASTVSAVPIAPVPAPTSSVASTKTDGSWSPCHQSYKATAKDVARDVAAMAKACEKPTKMKLVGKTLTGNQADQDKPQRFPFDAKANHCYRVYAQAADGIKDLDLVLQDSAGVVVGQDATDDPSPVVLEDGAVCFTKDDHASIVVSVGMGSGAYAVQVWGD